MPRSWQDAPELARPVWPATSLAAAFFTAVTRAGAFAAFFTGAGAFLWAGALAVAARFAGAGLAAIARTGFDFSTFGLGTGFFSAAFGFSTGLGFSGALGFSAVFRGGAALAADAFAGGAGLTAGGFGSAAFGAAVFAAALLFDADLDGFAAGVSAVASGSCSVRAAFAWVDDSLESALRLDVLFDDDFPEAAARLVGRAGPPARFFARPLPGTTICSGRPSSARLNPLMLLPGTFFSRELIVRLEMLAAWRVMRRERAGRRPGRPTR